MTMLATAPQPVPAGGLGVVYTRAWVADMILDLAGYVADRDLATVRAVEPAAGDGAFLRPMLTRLIESCRTHGRPLTDAVAALRAFDLDGSAVARSRSLAKQMLITAGETASHADALARSWVNKGDFLLPGPATDSADLIIGNPPYVRLENIPDRVSEQYRRRWSTMTGRADLYVAFIEAGLRALSTHGTLAYICPDRWMRNQYGRHLRQLVTDEFSLDVAITMHDADPFEDKVAAYPAVIVVRRTPPGPSLIVHANDSFTPNHARTLVRIAERGPAPVRTKHAAFTAAWLPHPPRGDESWPAASPDRLAVITDLETRFPPLGSAITGTRVGVGVATGCDAAFITNDRDLVEPDRLLPLVFARDVTDGTLRPSGRFLLNPWADGGELVNLDNYPRLRAALTRNASQIRARHIAKKRPASWYRTIDRVDPQLAERPKILLPDFKPRVHPVLDEGGLYPHHNLFFVTAEPSWDLRVLGGLLLSDIATVFVETYSVKMANGCLRVTAQYLRRIRIPTPDSISKRDAKALAIAFEQRNEVAATRAALRVYGISGIPAA